jgi:hypothetical protein
MVKKIEKVSSRQPVKNILKQLSKYPTRKESIYLLPLFSNQSLPLSAAGLPPSCLPLVRIEDLPFPQWAWIYMKQLSLHKFGDLLLCPGNKFLELSQFGTRKLAYLRKLVYKLITFNLLHNTYFRQKATVDALHLFPFYSGIIQNQIKPNLIHPSFCPQLTLSSLDLPVRALQAYKTAHIKNIGDLLFQLPKVLMNFRNFGEFSLSQTQQTIEKYLLSPKENVFRHAQSLTDVLINYSNAVLPPRLQKILCWSLGLLDEKKQTLENISHKFNCTRERVRQLIILAQVKLKLPANLILLKDLPSFMEKTAANGGGRIYLDELSQKLNRHYGWHRIVYLPALRFTISLCANLEVEGDVAVTTST